MLREFYETVLPPGGRYCLHLGRTRQHLFASDIDELVRKTEKLGDAPDVYFSLASLGDEDSRTYENAKFRQVIALDIDAGPEKVEKHGDAVYATQADALAAVVEFCKAQRLVPTYVVSSGAGLHVYFRLTEPLTAEAWKPLAVAVRTAAQDAGLKVDAAPTVNFVLVLRPIGTMHKSGNRVSVLQHIPQASYSPDDLRKKFNVGAPRKRSINEDVLATPVMNIPRTIHKIVAACPAIGHVARNRGDVSEPLWRLAIGIAKHTVEGADAAHALSSGHPDYDHDETERKLDRWTAGPPLCASFEAELRDTCRNCPHYGKIKSPIVLGTKTDVDVRPEDPAPAEPAPPPVAASMLDEFAAFTGDEPPPTKQSWPWEGHLPQGVECVSTGPGWAMSVKHNVKDPETGEASVVSTIMCGTPFWLESWSESYDTADETTYAFAVYNAATRTTARYVMPSKAAAKRDSLLTELATRGVHAVSDQSAKLLHDYVRKSIESIRISGQMHKIAGRFGVRSDRNGELFYAHGEYLIKRDGTISRCVPSRDLSLRAADYNIALPHNDAGQWGADVWDTTLRPNAKEYARFLMETIRPGQGGFKLAIMTALASPLMAHTTGYTGGPSLPTIGFTLSLYSRESGLGKTFCMKAAAGMFGSWEWVKPLNSTSSTLMARKAMLAQAGTLPMFMDEAGDGTDKFVAQELFGTIKGIGNGEAGRERLNSDGSRNPAPPICLTTVMATNVSIRDMIAGCGEATNAGLMRMLEVDCADMERVDKADGRLAEQRMESLKHTQGAIGALLHYNILRMGTEKLHKAMAHYMSEADAVVGGGSERRILSKALGAILAARDILAVREGIELWTAKEICDEFGRWAAHVMDASTELAETTSVRTVLASALVGMQAETVVTDVWGGTKRGPRGDAPPTIEPVRVLSERMPSRVTVRIITGSRDEPVPRDYVAWVDLMAFKRWCVDNGVRNPGSYIDKGLMEGYIRWNIPTKTGVPVKYKLVDLCRGLPGKSLSPRAFCINMARLGDVAGLVVTPAPKQDDQPMEATA